MNPRLIYCGGTTCAVLVSDGRTDETDAEWLKAFEAKRADLTARYGPPRVEEATASGCQGDKLVDCTGDGRATRKYSWAFIGKKSQFAIVSLGLTPITIIVVLRNEAWLEREHQRDVGGPK